MEERVLFEVAIVTLKSEMPGTLFASKSREDLFPCSAVTGISVSSPQYVDSMSKEDFIGF